MRIIYKRSRLQIFKEIYRDSERKNLMLMLKEVILLYFVYRELPVHYMSKYLFKRDAKNIKDFVPNRLSGHIVSKFNDQRLKQVLDNKLYFYLYYSQFGLNTPRILTFNHGNLFTSEGRTTVIKEVDEFIDFASKLFKSNAEGKALIIKKIYSSASGRSIHLLDPVKLTKENSQLVEMFQEIISSEYVFQERVNQHPELNRLNPSSLNTIRFDTFIDRTGHIGIMSGFLKMSTNNLVVDNNMLGGCGVGINLETGRLKKNGYSKIKMSGVGVLTEHPVTGVKFEDFIVPMIQEAQELVIKAAKLMPGLRMVGWDVGIAKDGPVIIEGNSDYGVNSNDLMYGGYMANPVFRKVLNEMPKN